MTEDAPAPVTGSANSPSAYTDSILRELGLSSTELRSYRFLLERGVATPTLVAHRTSQSRGRIYETLESLVRRGLARVEPSRPVRYMAVPLAEAVSISLAEALGRTQRLRTAFESLMHALPTPTPEATPPPTQALMRQLEAKLTNAAALVPPADLDALQVELHYYETVMQARRKISCLGPEGWSRHLTQGWQATIGAYAHARRRGVHFRALTPDNPGEKAALEPFRAVWDLRISEWLPAWVVIVDDEHLFQAVPSPSGGSPIVRHSRQPNDVRFYTELFEQLWSRGRPWGTPSPPTIGKN